MSTRGCAQLDAVLLCHSCALHGPSGQLRPSSRQSLASLGLTSANAAEFQAGKRGECH